MKNALFFVPSFVRIRHVKECIYFFVKQNKVKGEVVRVYEIKSLGDIHANQVTLYTIEALLKSKTFPKFSIFSGSMGVGKTSAAQLVAKELQTDGTPIKTYNFGLNADMSAIKSEVFSMEPVDVKAFVFEEIHSLSKEKQTALLSMLDQQPSTVYIIATTTEEDTLLKTLKSRAQRWTFKSLSNKQLSLLLDDYLKQLNKTMEPTIKQALVQAARGIPRDLVKSVDLAINGGFDAATLNELLGNISDDSAYTVFCALKSDPTSFSAMLSELVDKPDTVKVGKLRDFWTRYYIESSYKSGADTLSADVIDTLNSIFTPQDKQKVTKALIQATPSTLNLQLIMLNAMLNSPSLSTNQAMVGAQKVEKQEAEERKKEDEALKQQIPGSAKITAASLKSIRLD